MPIADALHVIRAFSYFAMLANIAEDTDHARRRRAFVQAGAPAPAGTLAHAIQLVNDSGLDPDDVRRAVAASDVVPVLTAHPTEIRRKTIQSIQTAVAALMEQRDRVAMNGVEEAEWSDELWRQIVTLWQTAMLRLTKLRLRDEVNDAMRYFELSLLSQGPMLNAVVNAAFGDRPDRERPLLRIGSWIGGDRDGNPFVTADVLADTFQQQATMALGHHLRRAVAPGRGAVDVVAVGRRQPRGACSWPRLRATHRRTGSTSRTAKRFAACTPAWRRLRMRLIGAVPGNPPIGERRPTTSRRSCWQTST